MTAVVGLPRPVSKPGEAKLQSANALGGPYVNINFFTDDLDLITMRDCVQCVNDILMNCDGMKEIIPKDYPWPMPRFSDEAMNKMILKRSQAGPRK